MELGGGLLEIASHGINCTQNLGREPEYRRNTPLLRTIDNKQSPADNRGFLADVDICIT